MKFWYLKYIVARLGEWARERQGLGCRYYHMTASCPINWYISTEMYKIPF